MQRCTRTIRCWELSAPCFDERLWRGGDFSWMGVEFFDPPTKRLSTVFHLHMAAHNGEICDLLQEIQRNPDKIDERCYYGASALHYACAANRPNCVRLLLQHGADANAVWLLDRSLIHSILSYTLRGLVFTDRWTSPLALAVAKGATSCVQLLLEHATEQDTKAAQTQIRCAIDEAIPFFVAATSPRSRATHFLPNDILRTIWGFLKPAKLESSFLSSMKSTRVCDTINFFSDVPPLRKASKVHRHRTTNPDAIDRLFAESRGRSRKRKLNT